ncbi:Rho termination factor N-terminal domain-containing protein, partial [Actinospica acidiphila]|uniref:Rho termination factor N-terminal domain-containing protein n=1 Tax=Actinospica acidiphila TaxID=304899 RepID=UPI0033075B0F
MSDTTDLMGARVEETAAAPATDASAPASGAGSRRRRGTGLEGMVLAELQQVASGLGIRGTARMRKSQLIEVIKEAQAAGGGTPSGDAPAKAESTETKPKRRATSRTRTGDTAEKAEKKTEVKDEQAPADKAAAQQQIDIPGQPSPKASAAEQAAEGAPERRRRRATADAG